jgi:hypothetical protein
MTDYTKFDEHSGTNRAVPKRMIDLPEALDRCLEYGLITTDVAATIKAYKEGFNDAVIQFEGPYA